MVPADRGLRCGLDWGTRPLHEDVEFHMRDMCRWGDAIVDDPALHGRTGEPLLHRDLHGNQEPIQHAHGNIHRKHKETYGLADCRAVQITCTLSPQRVPMLERATA